MQTTLYEWLNRKVEWEEDAATHRKDVPGEFGKDLRRIYTARRDAFREMLEELPIEAAEMIV